MVSQEPIPKVSDKEQPKRRFPVRKKKENRNDGNRNFNHNNNDDGNLKVRDQNSNESSLDQIHEEIVCEEVSKGRKRMYCTNENGSFEIIEQKESSQNMFAKFVNSYLLPAGYPDSVAPQYAPYMFWRGVQYFFGGTISVFTTRCLLTALGLKSRRAGEAAAAINWVVKDGAGRLGRLLFARWGAALDSELKQFRLFGDFLMESGALLELSTLVMPKAFLPLACTANLSKNLAAVAASSTRAPIYRTFAKSNNLADITAKGESVANLADIMGTMFGICLSKTKLPTFPTFAVLSLGYVISSRKEVDAVELPYFNRARLAYAADKYIKEGYLPDVAEANHREPLLPINDYNASKIKLGVSLADACKTPQQVKDCFSLFKGEPFAISYHEDKKQISIILRESASNYDLLRASFYSHVILNQALAPQNGEKLSDWLQQSKNLWPKFEVAAKETGWNLSLTTLNPDSNRVVGLQF
eukprot:TRINITY_DN7628_c0_g1_i10.p2 TRINITY_DN7628_c0_g1~~TRINITY_DN7628_c0_g1_i10.p2  ORF type:complete len:471 (+),score=68.99 TRINITY_DN7628_c0_g1_i10:186-1598(+)